MIAFPRTGFSLHGVNTVAELLRQHLREKYKTV